MKALRVLTAAEEACYLGNVEPLLPEVATILSDCGLRPEECFRLRWTDVRDGGIEIQCGKTDSARRRILLSQRAEEVLAMRRPAAHLADWVIPAQTRSGHIEPASVKREHLKACKGSAKDDKQTGEKRFKVRAALSPASSQSLPQHL